MEKEKTWRTANAMRVSPPCLLRFVRSSAGVPFGANVAFPTRPAMIAHVASSAAPVRSD